MKCFDRCAGYSYTATMLSAGVITFPICIGIADWKTMSTVQRKKHKPHQIIEPEMQYSEKGQAHLDYPCRLSALQNDWKY